jgi:hypothetical protein
MKNDLNDKIIRTMKLGLLLCGVVIVLSALVDIILLIMVIMLF